jgi:hypothetical protein
MFVALVIKAGYSPESSGGGLGGCNIGWGGKEVTVTDYDVLSGDQIK